MSRSENPSRTPPQADVHDPCGACDLPAAPAVPVAPPGVGWVRFRVPTMDCAAEESEIRRAVAGITGIRAMTFQLGQRSLALDAPGPAVGLAVAAIRKAGFDPQPLAAASPGAAPEHAGADDGHDHGVDPTGYGRLGMA